jgi:hypothetical protein
MGKELYKVRGGRSIKTKEREEQREKMKALALVVTGHPVRTPSRELDGVVDCPEHALDRAPPSPCLLVAKDHSLKRREASASSLCKR